MAAAPVTYTSAKAAMTKAGLPVSAGSNWTNVDEGSWNTYVTQQLYSAGGYSKGPLHNLYGANYGFPYPGEMPTAVADLVAASSYSATLAASAYTGAHTQTITLTLTETNGPGTSYAWTFGDGETATTAAPTTTHQYAAAGSYTPHVVPTVDGVEEAAVAVPQAIVLT
jgi:PKD repeat protein